MSLGYQDTPIIPGTNYHVHDGERPQPPVVTPGTEMTQQAPGARPSDAVALFDGTVFAFKSPKTGETHQWKVEDGYVEVVPGTGDVVSEAEFGDCQLHLEFCAPSVVKGQGQGRGNSGVFLMGRYEIQVLDCYENPTYPDGTTGGIYGQTPPLVNACRQPGVWQTYDILWEGPRWSADGSLSRPARVTVLLNGVVLHHARELQGPTQHKTTTNYDTPHPETGPLKLQDHGDLVRFRNIWYRPIGQYDAAAGG